MEVLTVNQLSEFFAESMQKLQSHSEDDYEADTKEYLLLMRTLQENGRWDNSFNRTWETIKQSNILGNITTNIPTEIAKEIALQAGNLAVIIQFKAFVNSVF